MAIRFKIQYQDQSGAQGKVAFDKVSIGSLSVGRQGFGCAHAWFQPSPAAGSPGIRIFTFSSIGHVTNGFGDGPNSGLLGLGFAAKYVGKSTSSLVQFID